MNVETGNEAVQFHFCEYMFRIFGAVRRYQQVEKSVRSQFLCKLQSMHLEGMWIAYTEMLLRRVRIDGFWHYVRIIFCDDDNWVTKY